MSETPVGTGEELADARTSRRNIIIGAGSIAAATAVVSSLTSNHVTAAGGNVITCDMPGIGTFALNSLQAGAGLGVGSAVGGNRSTSDPSVSEITVTKVTDSSTAALYRALLRATIVDPVTITFSFKGGTPTIAWVLHEVIVSGYSFSSGGDVPSESLSLNFTAFELTVNGNVVSYDLETQTAP